MCFPKWKHMNLTSFFLWNHRASGGCPFHTKWWYSQQLPVNLFTCGVFQTGVYWSIPQPSQSFVAFVSNLFEMCCCRQIQNKHVFTKTNEGVEVKCWIYCVCTVFKSNSFGIAVIWPLRHLVKNQSFEKKKIHFDLVMMDKSEVRGSPGLTKIMNILTRSHGYPSGAADHPADTAIATAQQNCRY